jgi:serine/threonine protein kinase
VKAFSKQATLLSNNPTHRLTLLNEIALMRAVRSPHVIKLEAVFESDNSVYVVLELLSAGHLHGLINRREGRFSGAQIRQFMAGLARGLTDLHSRGIMHRDIKP